MAEDVTVYSEAEEVVEAELDESEDTEDGDERRDSSGRGRSWRSCC